MPQRRRQQMPQMQQHQLEAEAAQRPPQGTMLGRRTCCMGAKGAARAGRASEATRGARWTRGAVLSSDGCGSEVPSPAGKHRRMRWR